MSVLGLLKKIELETKIFEKHPCRELDLETKIHYLNGLALLAKEDGDICEKEKEYLSILINTFGLSEDQLEDLIDFAQNPEQETVLEIIEMLKNNEAKYPFIVDSMILAQSDGDFNNQEKDLIQEYAKMMEISQEVMKEFEEYLQLFTSNDEKALYEKLRTSNVKKESIEHCFEYFDIDADLNFQNKNTYYKIADMAKSNFIFINNNNKVRTFNYSGGLGLGREEYVESTPVIKDLPENIKCISVSNSESRSLALFDNGDLCIFDNGYSSTWEDNSNEDSAEKIYDDYRVKGLPKNIKVIKTFVCGYHINSLSIALLENGELYTQKDGDNKFNFLLYNLNFKVQDVEVIHDDRYVAGLLLLSEDNKIFIKKIDSSFDKTHFYFDDDDMFEPKGLPENIKITQIAAGGNFVHVLLENNHLYALGQNDDGQLGIGERSNVVTIFTRVFGIEEPIIKLAANNQRFSDNYDKNGTSNGNFTVIQTSSNIYGWGANDCNQLGKKVNYYEWSRREGLVFKNTVWRKEYLEEKPKIIEELDSHAAESKNIELFCIDKYTYIWNTSEQKLFRFGSGNDYMETPLINVSKIDDISSSPCKFIVV